MPLVLQPSEVKQKKTTAIATWWSQFTDSEESVSFESMYAEWNCEYELPPLEEVDSAVNHMAVTWAIFHNYFISVI